MIYWPLSSLAMSPLMPQAYALELRNPFKHRVALSQDCANACFQVASDTQSLELHEAIMVQTEGGAPYWLFTEYPNFHAWARLERAGITIQPDGYPVLIFAPLH